MTNYTVHIHVGKIKQLISVHIIRKIGTITVSGSILHVLLLPHHLRSWYKNSSTAIYLVTYKKNIHFVYILYTQKNSQHYKYKHKLIVTIWTL